MRPWSSLALLAVVLVKWISGAHGRALFCIQPENIKICQILFEHNVAIHKRFLRFGRNFGEPFLRFGRSGTGAMEDDDVSKRPSSFEDKAYLRFGRSGMDEDDMMSILLRHPNYNGLQYRRKRESGDGTNADDKAPSRRRRSIEEASPVSADNRKRGQMEAKLVDLGLAEGKRQTHFPRFGRISDWNSVDGDIGNYEKRLMRFGRNGWLHFGKRVFES